jgi:hypothetical protein
MGAMAEDLTALRAFRSELAGLLQRVDGHIAGVEAAQRLTADEVRERKLDNARRDGATLARVEGYDTADAEAELRQVLRDKFAGDRQLVDEALGAARTVWRASSAA